MVLALALGACGSGDEDEAKKTVNGVYDALAEKDAKKVCDSLSREGRRQVTRGGKTRGQSCEKLLALGFRFTGNALKQAKDAEVSKVKVDGDKAVATVKLRNRTSNVDLIKESGEWKLNDLQDGGG